MKLVKNLAFAISAVLIAACEKPHELDTPAGRPEIVQADIAAGVSKMGADSHACLTEALYFEARGTGHRGMRAVGEVILNRKNDSRFPNTVCGVVDQRWNGSCQFSYRCDGIPEVYRERGQKDIAERIAATLLLSRGKDITNGALYFHAKSMAPGWFGTLSPRGRYGGNIFYR